MTTSQAGISDEDRSAITRCATDYMQSWLDGDGARMRASLHPALAKRGVYRDRSGSMQVDESPADAMAEAAAAGHGTKYGGSFEVEIQDVFRTIAAVKVTSEPYVDYLHMVRWDGRWLIINALWDFRDPSAWETVGSAAG
jgi:putative lumazine-binding protein